jgi:hypothetical protein
MSFLLKIPLIAMFVMSKNGSPDNAYRILSLTELNQIESTKRSLIDTTYIVDYNGAFATVFKDGTSILLPPVLGGKEGLFFYRVSDMNEMIKLNTFPVKGNNSFWENEKERALHFPDAMPYYCSKLTELLNYKTEFKDDASYLKTLSEVISKKLKSSKNSKTLINYLSIYVSELLRQRVDGQWQLTPQKALNVYYIPEIIKQEKFCSPWSIILGELELVSFLPIDIDAIIEKANVFYPIANRNYLTIKK